MVFGQGKIAYRDAYTVPDSSLQIINYEKKETKPDAATYINGKYYQKSVFHSIVDVLDIQKTNSFNIVTEDTVINGTLYHGKIHITLDSAFEIKVKEISLSAIKEKYANLKDYPAVFLLNGNLVTSDCDSYIIDENAILQIAFGKIQNPKIAFVEILTLCGNFDKNRKKY
jgi:hypothetical protein